GGTLAVGTDLNIGDTATGIGTMNVSGGVATAGALYVGRNGIGSLTQTGGSVSANSTTVNANGRINYNGGTLKAGALTVADGSIALSAGHDKVLQSTSVAVTG